MKAVNIRIDYLKNPIGLGNTKPRIYWNADSGIKQNAYQIKAFRGDEPVWDTGKIKCSKMSHIPYEGKPLKSRDRIELKILLWDENDKCGEETATSFEMGLLNRSDWSAEWISGDYKAKKGTRYPVDCFLKEFASAGKGGVKRARLYASARGLYDIKLNGRRIEDFILAPGMTDYRKRIQYQTYDVTELINDTSVINNRMEIRLADGWYRGSCAAYGVTNVYGIETSLIAQLEIEYADGVKQTVITDGSFKWSNDDGIRFADLKDGEIFNAQFTPSYNGKAKVVTAPKVGLTASDNVYVKEKERFKGTPVIDEPRHKVIDFGQNIAGYLEFDYKGNKNDTCVITLGEILNEDKTLNMSGIRETIPADGWSQVKLIKKLLNKPIGGNMTVTPKQEIKFTSDGVSGHYKTSFSVFGFRFIEIEGDIPFEAEDVTAIAVYSDMERTGEFNCSNRLVNKLFENSLWSMKGNFLDIPTDCPTRERLGWTGDAQIFFNTGAYMMDTAAFFRKWLRDMADAQYKNGLMSAVIPYQGVEMMYKATGQSVGWADAVYLIPYRFYKMYGDFALLEDFYPYMKRYAEYLISNTGLKDKKAAKSNPYDKYTYEKGVHLGEWLEPEEFRDKVYGASAPHPEECTAYFHYTMKIMSEIAQLLNKGKDADRFWEYAEGSKTAYYELFIKNGSLNTKRQAKIVRPLALGLLDFEDTDMPVNKGDADSALVKAVRDYSYRVGTGFLSTPFMLPALSDAGYTDDAYKMLLNEESPGWLYEIKNEATTIWESWEGDLSQNHYSPGAVCEWLFAYAAGIRPDGENRFIIKPYIYAGDEAGEKAITHLKASWQSIYGAVKSGWEKNADGSISLNIEIPPNTEAELIFPDGTRKSLMAGTFTYNIPNLS